MDLTATEALQMILDLPPDSVIKENPMAHIGACTRVVNALVESGVLAESDAKDLYLQDLTYHAALATGGFNAEQIRAIVGFIAGATNNQVVRRLAGDPPNG